MLIITTIDISSASASLNRLFAIARGVCENGEQVYWIVSSFDDLSHELRTEYSKYVNFVDLGNIRFRKRLGKLGGQLRSITTIPLIMKYLDELKEEFKPQACFTVGDNFFMLFIIYKILQRNGIRILHERTEYPLLNRSKSLFKRFEVWLYHRYFLPKVNQLFVISTALYDYFSIFYAKIGLKVPIMILNMMVEPDKYSVSVEGVGMNCVDSVSEKRIVYVGNMYGDKDGVYDLVSAFFLIRDLYPNVRLILIGDNRKRKLMDRIYKLTKSENNHSQIIFTGKLSTEEIKYEFMKAYCLALSRPDNEQAKYGFPTKLGEYLASGKPVVITKVGDIPLFLKDGENAYLAEPSNVDSISKKLQECLDNPLRARIIGEKGKELAHTSFNYKECTQMLVDACQ